MKNRDNTRAEKRRGTSRRNYTATPLCKAIDATAEVAGHACPGLQALKKGDASKISCNTDKLGVSLDIDSTLKESRHQEHRWDYVVEYGERIYFIEVHPASAASRVSEMIAKVDWLNEWLKKDAPEIGKLKRPGERPIWIHTGKNTIGRAGMRRLAQKLQILPALNLQ
ncbi:MAG: hypothetical protein NC187_06055 [Candidatus Amulumruptor caecigallinarius]|nr:hypothetical protein [Candidatus Amulumruptor caecigallinarius]MCM1397033.1 hypothetical protein [Candidatus Amulumruptor caecigallinarius]MCM1454031.1 hypothetical protein [bacterium]